MKIQLEYIENIGKVKTVYYHGSPKDHGEILTVKSLKEDLDVYEENLFGGVFLSQYKQGHIGPGKNYWYTIELADHEILDLDTIYHGNYDKYIKGVLEDFYVYDDISEDDISLFVDIIAERRKKFSDEEAKNLFIKYDIISESEGDWEWYLQTIQGQIAKKLGYKAVSLTDERGSALLIPGPAKLEKVI